MQRTRRRLARGFTAIELMITIAILSITVSIALPSYTTIVRNGVLAQHINSFYSALNMARSEAIKRGAPVSVCPSTDQAACAASGTQWEQGWIVFVDSNNNHVVDGTDQVLWAERNLTAGYTLRGSSATTLPSYFTMNPKGAPSATGQYVLCQAMQINPARAILVSMGGRISIATDNNGVPVAADASNMTSCTP